MRPVTEFVPAEADLVRAVRGTTDKLTTGRLAALAALADPAAARARARAARQRAVSTLAASLAMFEKAAAANGTIVHRAVDAAAAVRAVEGILARAAAKRIVKSKSMATEEIHLRDRLEHAGREVVETDLGEWIVQLAEQMPSHIIVPAVHLPRQRIRALLSAVAGRDLGAATPGLAAFAREHLRRKFLEADAGISGGNVLIAETGSLMIVSNEGNARMCTTLPRVHVAVVGVEKVVRGWADACAVLAVLPRSATGQAITQYVSFLSGPRRPGDPAGDGPEEVHVVLLDNGRSRLVGTPAEELLYCIRCGACLNVCPVYRTMGGHAYGSVYPGPIGAALTPRLTQGRQGRDLPWASSLCGACREACPVGIALDDQLIALRAEHPKPLGERVAMKAFAVGAGRPGLFRAGLHVARVVLGGEPSERLPGALDGWTRSRSLKGLARLSRRYPGAGTATAPAFVPVGEIGETTAGRGRPALSPAEAGAVGASAAGRGTVAQAAEAAAGAVPVAAGGVPGTGAGAAETAGAVAGAVAGAAGAAWAVRGTATQAAGTAGPTAGRGLEAGGTAAVPGTGLEAAGAMLEAFAAQWCAQGGQVRLVRRADLEAAVRQAVGEGRVSADAVLGGLLLGLPEADVLAADVGVVWAEAASAETGSLILRSGEHTQRRRSLVPPRTVFVVDAATVHADVETAFGALDLLGDGERPAAVTVVSGPSRSADIENDLVIGVHGPGDVWTIVVTEG